MTQPIFMVRAGGGSVLVDRFLSEGIVAVGWQRLGDLSSVTAKSEIEQMIVQHYAKKPGWKPTRHYMEIGEFVLDIGPGTPVMTVDARRRRYLTGVVTGQYEYWPDSTMRANDEVFHHVRSVEWHYQISRDDVSLSTLKELDQQGKTAVWLSDAASADFAELSASGAGAPIDVKDVAVHDTVEPASKAPTDAGDLASWIQENERRAATLPIDYLTAKAAAASREPKKVGSSGAQYVRDPYVSALVKRLADGTCELCKKPAPFSGKDGSPYLESHHVEWLSRGGADAIENVAALCPNCHRKMHVRDDAADVSVLAKALSSRRA